MRYTLLVLTPPDAGASAQHALGFAGALVDAGHALRCVFFYDAGVLTALDACETPQDERDLRSGWQALAAEHSLPLHACVASAARFGVALDDDASRLLAGFSIAGLGELIEASSQCDRLITFAG